MVIAGREVTDRHFSTISETAKRGEAEPDNRPTKERERERWNLAGICARDDYV